jgi:ATP-dependent helicase HrpB
LRGNREHLAGATVNRAGCERVRRASEQWRRQLQLGAPSGDGTEHTGTLLAFAYPDRIAQRIAGSEGRYRLANGRGAAFHTVEGLSQEEYLVVAQLDGTG